MGSWGWGIMIIGTGIGELKVSDVVVDTYFALMPLKKSINL